MSLARLLLARRSFEYPTRFSPTIRKIINALSGVRKMHTGAAEQVFADMDNAAASQWINRQKKAVTNSNKPPLINMGIGGGNFLPNSLSLSGLSAFTEQEKMAKDLTQKTTNYDVPCGRYEDRDKIPAFLEEVYNIKVTPFSADEIYEAKQLGIIQQDDDTWSDPVRRVGIGIRNKADLFTQMNYVARITHNRPTQILLSVKGNYGLYEKLLAFLGKDVEITRYNPDVPEEIDITKQYDCAITCDPDNPTGKEVSQKLFDVLGQCVDRRGLINESPYCAYVEGGFKQKTPLGTTILGMGKPLGFETGFPSISVYGTIENAIAHRNTGAAIWSTVPAQSVALLRPFLNEPQQLKEIFNNIAKKGTERKEMFNTFVPELRNLGIAVDPFNPNDGPMRVINVTTLNERLSEYNTTFDKVLSDSNIIFLPGSHVGLGSNEYRVSFTGVNPEIISEGFNRILDEIKAILG